MEGDRGFYTWLKPPAPQDSEQKTEDWRLLTPEALDELIGSVTAWYRQKQQVAA